MKIIYNSKLARLLLPGYQAILIMFVLLCKKGPDYYDEKFLRHEKAHFYQWTSLSIVGLIFFAIVSLFLSNAWFLLLAPFVFYIWYSIEWLTRFMHRLIKTPPLIKFGIKKWWKGVNNLGHEAYRAISFEQEARLREKGCWTLSIFSFTTFY